MENCKSHEPITQEEINYEHSDEEVVEFDDELDSESKIELQIDLVIQKLINTYPFWLVKKKKIKEMEVKKIINIKSYQKAQLYVRQVIIRELQRKLIQEWREQKRRYTPRIPDYESEEETKNLTFSNEQNNDNSTIKMKKKN